MHISRLNWAAPRLRAALRMLMAAAVCAMVAQPPWATAQQNGDAPTAVDLGAGNANGSDDAAENAAPSDEAIAELVRRLDDDRFSVREQATKRLQALGNESLDAVADAAGSESLEVSSRAVGILLNWVESGDRQLAVTSIERLAGLENHPTESRLANELLASVREYLAAEEIERLGGHVYIYSTVGSRPIDPPAPLKVVIDLDWTGGDEGLKLLKDLPHAVYVSFHSAPVGEASLPYLLELPSLRIVEFFGTPVSTESVRKLEENLPKLIKVDVRSAALLGVAGDMSLAGGRQGGALVSGVQEGGAAEQAGVERGDVIVGLDGVEVADFEHLTKLLSDYQPGQEATLSIVRPTPNAPVAKELTVSFDRWGERPLEGESLLDHPAEDVQRYLRWLPQRDAEPRSMENKENNKDVPAAPPRQDPELDAQSDRETRRNAEALPQPNAVE